MAKIISYLVLSCVCLTVFILTDYTESRGISNRKRSNGEVKNLDESIGIRLRGDERLLSDKIKGPRCVDTECQMETKHKHRHQHGRKQKTKKKKSKRRNSKKRRKSRRPSRRQKDRVRQPEDVMQRSSAPSDSLDLASYDQFYAGVGRRRFGRLQRPPEADRLERRLHPNIATSASNLLNSIDRVVLALKSNIQEMHRTYDYAFNSTRYTIMLGVRSELSGIAEANDMVYDVVLDISLLTKEIYMRAHRRGLTRPRTSTLDMPTFKSLADDISATGQEQNRAQRQRDQAQDMFDDCQRQKSHLQQLKEDLEDNTNRRELLDLRRQVNMTLGKLQAEFDTFMVVQKLERYMLASGGTTLDDYQEASTLLRLARIALRTAAENSRGNAIAYEDWLRRQRGDGYGMAPVSFTDIRPSSDQGYTSDLSPSEKARLRPIINDVVRHASNLRDRANRIKRLLRPIVSQASTVTTSESGQVSYRVQASLLAEKLVKDVVQIRFVLDRLRIAINDEDELRQRCEELEMGSGDDGEATPIDCDEFMDIGSANDSDEFTSIDKNEDLYFEGEKMPETLPGKTVKRFGDKLKVHVIQLRQNSVVTLAKSTTARNKTHELSDQWTLTKNNLGTTDRFITEANKFLIDFSQERLNIDRISERIQSVHEKVDIVYNLTQNKTLQAVLKAEKKLAEVKGEKGGKTQGGAESRGGSNQNSDFAAAFDAAGKAKTTMRSITTLTQITPSLIEGVDQRVNQIKANISSLRSKVDKARMVLASIQISIDKKDESYLPLSLSSSDESHSLHTSVDVCIKPQVSDGAILLVTGNNAESYSISMEGNAVKAKVYDNAGYDIGEVTGQLTTESTKWYSIKMKRAGDKLSLSVQPEGEEEADTVEEKLNMAASQPHPLHVYIGGAPDTLSISLGSEVWKGCLGGLRVNGKSVGLLQKASDGNVPLPCDSHCTPSPITPSLVFEGSGYMHFPADISQLRHRIQSVNFEFRSRQQDAFLISVVKGRFNLRAQLSGGTLVIETTTPSEAIVLKSQNTNYNDGVFHKLRIVYRDSTTYPEIDGEDGLFSIEATRPEMMRSPAEGVLVGGMLNEHSNRIGKRISALVGCMRNLQINDNSLDISEVAQTEGVHTGSCSDHNMWLSCVEFLNTSSPIAYGTTQDAETVVLVITRGSIGPVLQYKKGDKFDAVISLTTKGIEVKETVRSYEGFLPYNQDDNDTFVTIEVKNSGSSVYIESEGQDLSFSYWSLWSFGTGSDPFTVIIGGQEAEADNMHIFTGGISQMIVGSQYLDLTTYIYDNNLASCKRPRL